MAIDEQKLQAIFAEAASLAPAERSGVLDRLCAGDTELRRRAEALLRAHDDSEDLPPVAAPPGATGEFTPEPGGNGEPASITDGRIATEAGTVIDGRYTLIERIGEGGMGEVWIARQSEPVKRKVALKLIKAGMDTRAVLKRFDVERLALALMDHPNIARVFDGGMTGDRRPYFVMELVNGLPLTKFCDEAKLTPRQRLELFVPICQAVQHAHQKGIVHRDLKPSNILVTVVDGKPTPKVIDFGVAKAVGGHMIDESLVTGFGSVVGTFEYMAPEQAGYSGDDIDTRADIYSLGVLLYELLTGLRPIDTVRLRKAAMTEMVRIIQEEEPSKPSTRLSSDASLPSMAALRQTEPRRLMAILRGELDWVVMKCLEKQRDRRYETANGLARDIQRYLADEPVEARPPSATYRFRKFIRRHKGQAFATGLVLAALLGGITGTSWGLYRARQANAELVRANARVDQRYALAVDAIKTFHTGVSEDFLLKQEAFKDLRDRLLRGASDFYGRLSAMLGTESDVASRRALAQSNFELAELTVKVGRIEDALATHRGVLAARQALAAEPEADATIRADVGRSLTALASVLELAGKTDEALATFRQSETLLASLDAGDPTVRAALGNCRLRLGWLLTKLGKSTDALAVLKLAQADQNVAATVPGPPNQARRDEADALVRMGLLHFQTGKVSEAEAEYRAALVIQQKLVEENPTSIAYRNSLAFTRNSLGLLLSRTGRPAEAEAEYRAAMAIYEKLTRENPAVTEFRSRLGQSHHNLGSFYSAAGKYEASEAAHRAALAVRRVLVDENPSVTDYRSDLASTHNNFANLLMLLNRSAEAATQHDAALSLRRALAGAEPGNPGWRRGVALSLSNLGSMDTNAGRFEAAITRYRESAEIHERLVREHPQVTDYKGGLAFALTGLGRALQRAGRPAEAVEPLRQAINIRRAITALNLDARYDLACCHALLAEVVNDPNEADRSLTALRQAVDAGYSKIGNLLSNPDFERLRTRDDFKKLVDDLRTKPRAESKP
ncbi:MAG: tetratricopeptide repeat protein [Gemmataceae bacterium]|nr:tetratricopeptide repeat protein [Gemmataceae bacterium]